MADRHVSQVHAPAGQEHAEQATSPPMRSVRLSWDRRWCGPTDSRAGRRCDAQRAARPGATTGSGRRASSIGSALGAAATVVGRRAERTRPARTRGLAGRRADRDRPSREGAGRARRRPSCGPPSPPTPRRWPAIVPALSAALGTELPGVVERSGVVDRAGWVRANIGSFASLIGKLEADLLDQVVPPGGGLAKATMALANRWVTTRQLGFLLGFMGQRVLGQYDLALLSAEAGARAAPVRRGEHPRDRRAAWACRSGRSGPGSPCTRRPMPSSSRRIPGCGRISRAPRAPAHAFGDATPRAGPRRDARARPGAPRRGRRASTGWSG